MATNGHPRSWGASPGAVRDNGLFASQWDLARLGLLRRRPRYWLHALLLLLTFISTTIVGASMARAFAQSQPFTFDIADYARPWWHPQEISGVLVDGLPFSITLLVILLAHEFGHYLAARYYGVNATLPFFLPAPTPIGTFGAFIKIRSAILSRKILFDIGAGGPLAGFAVLLLPLVAGVSLSKVIPGIANSGELIYGTPLVLRAFEWILFPGIAPADIYLHPVARAAWVGLLATALNLLPIGQLDGGHILYAFLGDRTKYLSRLFVVALVPLGIFFAYSWLVWALLLFIFGMRHPSIVDPSPVGRTRAWLAVTALLVLILSFTATPIRTPGL